MLCACGRAPQSVATGDRAAAQAAIDRGIEAHEAGDFHAAEAAYLEATRLDPSLAWAYYKLGVLAANFNRWGTAESYFWRAIAVDPDLMPPYYELGVRRAMAGEYEGAAQLL